MRIAMLLILGTGYQVALDVWRASTYHPWSLDVYHLSSLAAFMCACGVGVITYKMVQ